MPRAEHQSFLRHPLTWVLGNNANLSVIRELSLHGAERSAAQLTLRTGLAASSVQSALTALVETGLVLHLGGGKSRLYRVEHDHPLFPALSALWVAETQRFFAIRAAVAEAASTVAASSDDKVEAAWLYGSVARSEDRPDSDVDIAVLAIGDVDRATDAFRAVLKPSERRLVFRASIVGIGHEDVAMMIRKSSMWWAAVLEDSITLYGSRPEDAMQSLRTTA